MNYFSKIFRQTFWQVLGKAATSISTFIILGLIARNYGEAGTGVFTLALTYLAIFYLLADFGFNAHVLRRVKDRDLEIKIEWQKLLGTRILWSLVLVILAVSLLPLWPFATSDFTKAVIIGSPAIIFSGVFITCNLFFQSKLRYDLSVLAVGLGTVGSLTLFLFFSLKKYPVSSLVFAHLIGWIIIAFFAWVLIRKFIFNIFPVFDIKYALSLFKQSWLIAATLALNVLYFRADAFLISYFRTPFDVGVYNVAYSVFQSALVLPTFIMNSYYPLMLKSFGNIKYVGLSLLGLSFFGTFFTLVFAPLVIEVLTGGGFAGSVQSLQILSLGFPAYFLSSLFMWIFIAKGKYKEMFLLYTSGLFLNLILNFLYIPKYSFLAASWVTVISEYFILLIQIFLIYNGTRKRNHLKK
ncbi:MAG: hypothetical protein ACD_38C00193G0012 [uncultured bacterium]|uniref:Heteropolysaccharide repeat unit export protein n=1 Tax=Candidatus Daviesbacteria bacterium GW2011_GWC2_40_12 TaxID=1618431 RepID=A0A0G0T365_9BACT|nr:MAG: hypothetical protein ACD_38C00193G0012 [uncultured bacterium]KKR15952.1 MAG: Heteropolysaccharide repeat unit export protein [Candidatus Daviesbacteria bacterium GW2011_GWA2_39_33]KKR23191.1 MAG: Heteropolysaccharide repeat unit export protein [Candidatus Daviesbacteria bacterium GW2011_GWB1_39_5]KKR41560.1 MAG: Heteropolysaccharide repeat unit export protein [Candidatus Daviesbacteria bacterium GW2011_GWC2_40_12]OGE20769.1 MAG: hypothetical protein A2778_05870 [Candidatus Daviesbacteri